MASEIEELILEQQMTNLHLELLESTRKTNEDILLEAMVSNELLNGFSGKLDTLGRGIAESLKTFHAGIKDIAVEESSATTAPLLLAPGQTEQALMDARDVTPKAEEGKLTQAEVDALIVQQRAVTDASAKALEVQKSCNEKEEDFFEDQKESSKEQLTLFQSMSQKLGALVKDAKDRAAKLLAVDRQKDKSSDGLFENFGGKLGAALTKGGLIGLAGLATGTFVKSIFDGLTDEKLIESITGKASKDLTASEKTFAALANAVEQLSFGLFSAKEVFDFAQPAAERFQMGVDALFDPDTGVFAEFTTSIVKLFDGDLRGALTDVGTLLWQFPMKIFELGQRIGTELLSLLPTSFTEGLEEKLDPILQPIFAFTLETIPNAFQTASDTIIGGLNYVLELPAKIATAVSEFSDKIISSLKEKVSGLADKLPFDTGKKLMNLFETKPAETPEQPPAPVLPLARADMSTAEPEALPQTPRERLFAPVLNQPAGPNVPRLTAPTDVNAERTTQLSQQRMQEQKVVVNTPAPQPVIIREDKKEEKKITRRKESNDLTLAFMGQGSF